MLIDKLEDYNLPREYLNILKEQGIVELNPVQLEAVSRGLFSDVNMVITAPTASGKTLIAELALVKAAMNGGKGVYLTPLRALANEKYEDFKKLEKIGIRVGISTGDYDQPADYLGENDIIVATYERFDSLMRIKPLWIKNISLIVIDELHNINDPERGPIIEMIVARALRDKIRVIGLSATIRNPNKLSKWIEGILVSSSWRPVKLVEGVYDKKRSIVVFADGREESLGDHDDDEILNLVFHNLKNNYQTLVFIHNRKKVEEYALRTANQLPRVSGSEISQLFEELESAPTRLERELISDLISRGVSLHHAGLSHATRKVIETAFKKRILKVVYATPTLAAGVNLPARRVLVSIKRYDPEEGRRSNITIAEYKQMAGRAGRPQYDEIGESIIIDASILDEGFKYIHSEPEPVEGNLYSERSLRIHVLSTLASQEARTLGDIVGLFKYTYSAYSNRLVDLEKIVEKILELLERLNMIYASQGALKPTSLGRVTSYCYIDPLTVEMFIRHKPGKYIDIYMLHLVSLTPDVTKSSPYVPRRVLYQYEELAQVYLNNKLVMPIDTEYYSYETWLQGFIYAMVLQDWINEKTEDEIYEKYGLGPGDIYNLRDTAAWVTSSLGKIAGVLGDIQYNKKLLELAQRLEKGVKEDAVELASLRYIGRVRARVLIEHGIKTLEDLAKTPSRKLVSLPTFGSRIVEEIKKQLSEMSYEVVP